VIPDDQLPRKFLNGMTKPGHDLRGAGSRISRFFGGRVAKPLSHTKPERGLLVPDDDLEVTPASVDVFYDESKAAHEVMDQVLVRYRTNTGAALALATGAATFFGFSTSPKGLFFAFSLFSYAVAALVAIAIYWPAAMSVNVAHDVGNRFTKQPPLLSTKLKYDLAKSHQEAIQKSRRQIGKPWGLANKFRILLSATSLVVVFAGFNSYLESRHPTATQPTHIVVDPIHIAVDPMHVAVDPMHIAVDPTHISIDPTCTVVIDPTHIDTSKDGK
jgi:hypothetical protein